MIISFNTGKIESGGGSSTLQDKRVVIMENGLDVVVPDAGYDGLGTVYVKTYVTDTTGKKDFSTIGYDEELNIKLNEEIDEKLAYSKSLYDKQKDNMKGNKANLFLNDNVLYYAPALDTSQTTDASSFFKNCGNLKIVPYYDWSNCKTLNNMFYSNKGVEELDLSSWDVSNVSDIKNMFYNCSNLVSLNITGWDISNITHLGGLFTKCSNLIELVGLKNWDVSNVTVLDNVFQGCASLKSLDLSSWDVSKTNSANYLFSDTSGLTYLNLDGWNLTSLTSLSYSPFGNAGSTDGELILTNAKLPNLSAYGDLFKTLNFKYVDFTGTEFYATNFANCFYQSKVQEIRGFKISTKPTTLKQMFYGCSKLTDVDFVDLDTSECTDFAQMFYNCINLTEAPSISLKSMPSTTINSSSKIYQLFYSCGNIKTFGGFYDCEHITNWGGNNSANPFYNTAKLENITGFGTIKGTDFSINISTLTVDSIMVLLNALYDYSEEGGTHTIKIGSTNLAKLTDEQKAVATSKGWLLS